MQKTGGNVEEFIAAVTPAKRRADAETILSLMREVTGREPEMWGTIVGFGSCHYKYPTGNEGDMPITAFAPRKQATTIYLLDAESHSSALERLGPHTIGRSCLYLKDVAAIDLDVLREILAEDERRTRGGGIGYAELTITD